MGFPDPVKAIISFVMDKSGDRDTILDDLKQVVVRPADVPVPTGKEISSMLVESVEAQIGLTELLALPTLFDQGVVTSATKRGSFLSAFHVAPRTLTHSSVSRIAYLSKLFTYWRGEIEFELVVTKSKFQELKLVMVYVPGTSKQDVLNMSVEELCSYQISKIVDTSTDRVMRLRVPFISECNWVSTGKSTGVFALVLFDSMISVMDVDSPASWSLFVSSPRGRDQIKFRNAVPPPRQPGDVGQTTTTIADEIGRQYASASSGQKKRLRMDTLPPLSYESGRVSDRPNGGYPVDLRYSVPVYFRGKNLAVLAQKLANLNISPPSTFVASAGTTFKSLVPYLPVLNIVGQEPPGITTASTFAIRNATLKGNQIDIATGSDFSTFQLLLRMTPELAESFDGWRVIMMVTSGDNSYTVRLSAKATDSINGRASYKYLSLRPVNSTVGSPSSFPSAIDVGKGIYFVDDPTSIESWNKQQYINWIESSLRSAEMRTTYSYFNVYVAGEPYQAETIRDWLTNSDNLYPPRHAIGVSCSLSLANPRSLVQAASAIPSSRGVVMWLFKVFGGDDDSVIGRVLRVVDVMFDLFLPLVVGYDGTAYSQDVENMRFEYVSDMNSEERNPSVRVAAPPLVEPPHWDLKLVPQKKRLFGHQSRSPEIQGARTRSHSHKSLRDAVREMVKH